MKYMRNPEIVEAFKYDGDFKDSYGNYYVPDWAVKFLENGKFCFVSTNGKPPELCIKRGNKNSGENLEMVNVGDYITMDENGLIITYDEKYFNETFKPVE